MTETRKATEVYSNKLTKRTDTNVKVKDLKMKFERTRMQKLRSYLGLTKTLGDDDDDDSDEYKVPTVFCYSLFYVYYDQYTYITGVLAQNIALGLVAVFIAIQVSYLDLFFILFINIGLKLHLNFLLYYFLCLFGFL